MKKIDISFLEPPILLAELFILFSFGLIVYSVYGSNLKYYAIVSVVSIVIFWRMWCAIGAFKPSPLKKVKHGN